MCASTTEYVQVILGVGIRYAKVVGIGSIPTVFSVTNVALAHKKARALGQVWKCFAPNEISFDGIICKTTDFGLGEDGSQ